MITRFGLFMERFWMVVSVASVIPAVYVLYQRGWEASRDLWLLTSLCVAMWLFRIFTRKRMEAWQRRQEEQER